METEPTIEYRQESDTFGPIQVPSHKYWGAQTQRSLQNFAIGTEQDKIPLSVVKSLAIIKKCAEVLESHTISGQTQCHSISSIFYD